MANASNSLLLHGLSGAIGNEVIVKNYGKKTMLGKCPDMIGIKPSKAQKAKRSLFAGPWLRLRGSIILPV